MKLDEKGIISLVKNDFTPLEESKEGNLKGGFGSVTQTTGPTVLYANNCRCNGNKNNCDCPNESWVPEKDGNNCKCGTTAPPTPTPPPTTPGTGPIPPTSTHMLTGFGF